MCIRDRLSCSLLSSCWRAARGPKCFCPTAAEGSRAAAENSENFSVQAGESSPKERSFLVQKLKRSGPRHTSSHTEDGRSRQDDVTDNVSYSERSSSTRQQTGLRRNRWCWRTSLHYTLHTRAKLTHTRGCLESNIFVIIIILLLWGSYVHQLSKHTHILLFPQILWFLMYILPRPFHRSSLATSTSLLSIIIFLSLANLLPPCQFTVFDILSSDVVRNRTILISTFNWCDV